MAGSANEASRMPWVVIVILAVVTGVLSALTFTLAGGSFLETVRMLSPGLWYGVFLGGFLAMHHALRPWWKAILFLVLVTVVWYGAVFAALWTPEQIGLKGLTVAGLIGGIVGGAGMAGIAALLLPTFRQPRLWGAILIVGSGAGLVLGIDNPYVLFCVWQAAVAAILGYGLFGVRKASA